MGRERESARIIRFIMWYCIMLGALMTIGVFTIGFRIFTLKVFLPLAIIPIPLCILSDYVVEKLGSGFGGVLSGWSSRRATLRETFAADLAKARYSKRQGRFKEALSIIENVLDRDPEFPDALYLKARILWEGFNNREGAAECLKKVMKRVPSDETLHRWASNYYDEVTGSEERRQTHSPPKRE
ncbi:MAG: tetratricopeptide repeat protein [Desulfatiglandales bacterium]